MKRYVIYFLISFGASFLPFGHSASAQDTLPAHNRVAVSFNHSLPRDSVPGYYIDGNELVLFLEKTLGSFLTTLAMYMLHRKYPKIFPTVRKSAYLPERFRRQRKQ
jgi:hypothetical protein